VVTFPPSSIPWNPATTATSPRASAARSGSSSIRLMRALLNVLSVTMRHWWARKLAA
jgi:hypothetical protein